MFSFANSYQFVLQLLDLLSHRHNRHLLWLCRSLWLLLGSAHAMSRTHCISSVCHLFNAWIGTPMLWGVLHLALYGWHESCQLAAMCTLRRTELHNDQYMSLVTISSDHQSLPNFILSTTHRPTLVFFIFRWRVCARSVYRLLLRFLWFCSELVKPAAAKRNWTRLVSSFIVVVLIHLYVI